MRLSRRTSASPRAAAAASALLAIAALSAPSAAAPAQGPANTANAAGGTADPDASAGPNCINRRDIRDLTLVDKRTLLVRMSAGPDYVSRFEADCRFRDGLDTWLFSSPSGLICKGEALDVATRGIGRTGFCRLGPFEAQPREPRPQR